MHVRTQFIRLILALALLVALLPLSPAQPAAAATSQNGLSPESFLNLDGTLDIPEGFSGSFDLEGWDVSLDDARGPVLRPAAAPLNDWEALNDGGLNGIVYALAVLGSDLYVGGTLTQSAGGATTGLNRIARYDTTTGSWHALADNGLNGDVYALAVLSSDLYVGGDFTQSAGGATTGLNRIARYDTAGGSWHAAVDNGLNNNVRALAVLDSDLYVGGYFTQSAFGATTGLNRIARYDTTAGSWHALADNGLNNNVRTLKVLDSDLYMGGPFTASAGGATAGLNNIARYDTATGSWHALADNGLNNIVLALAVLGSDLYLGGEFTQSAGGATTGLNRIARYDTTTGSWHALADNGLSGFVYGLMAVGSDLYVGGSLTQSAGGATTGLNRIARYDTAGGNWYALADNGLNNNVRALTVLDSDLYVGGQFSQSADGAHLDLGKIAAYGIPDEVEAEDGDEGGDEGGPSASTDIAATGTTTLQLGEIIVEVPAAAVAGLGDCRLGIEDIGRSGQFGFTLNDTVWDVDIICDGVNQHIFFAPITICIQGDGSTAGKQVFHRDDDGGSWSALAVVDGLSGYVCAETRVLSLFTLGSVSLPATGFAPDMAADLDAEVSYAATGLMLDIPALDISLPIVGVPQDINGWDVSWLGSNAGFLQGTAFPTFVGNTVITAHVWGADNQPGPFAELETLQHGDRFTISAWGSTYTYEVRSNETFSPASLRPLAGERYDWVTLITCQGFDEASGEYLFRRVVRAVLVAVN